METNQNYRDVQVTRIFKTFKDAGFPFYEWVVSQYLLDFLSAREW